MNPKCIPECTMREALDDPNIFGKVLAGPSWTAWRVILIACRGEPLTNDERIIFTALTGREREPDAPCDEVWGKVGRRGGKTRAFAVLGAYLAALIDYSAVQAPGERLKLPILASTNKQATKAFTYILGIFKGSPDLFAMMDGEATQDTISLKQGVDIEVTTANFRTVRGETLVGVLCDEIAFWHLDGSANPDSEILNAARPGLVTTGGPMAVFSSPYARKGELYRTFEQEFGPNGDPGILVLSAPSLTMNPELDPKLIERARKRDPVAASAEYDAEFRKDVEAFISIEAFRACLDTTATERLPQPGVIYRAFVDVSGGGADAMTLAIGHAEGDLAVLDVAREMPAGTPPAAVVAAFAETLKIYRVSAIRGDRYGKEWVQERFRAEGITYEESEQAKSDIYAAFLPVLNSEKCRLLPIEKLEAQMIALERRTARGTGRDIIDHPQRKGAHDDLANSVCGVIVMLSQGSRPIVVTKEQAMAFGAPHQRRFPIRSGRERRSFY